MYPDRSATELELSRHLRDTQRVLEEELDAHAATRARNRRQAWTIRFLFAALCSVVLVGWVAWLADEMDWSARLDVERRRGDYWQSRAVEHDPGENVIEFYRRSRDWVRAR